MKLPIHIETQEPNSGLCGDNCPFLKTSVDGGFCILFSEELIDVSMRQNYITRYARLSRCATFDEGE